MELPPEKWERVKALLEEALELRPEENPAFLAKVPEEDVRRELERLLAYRGQVATASLPGASMLEQLGSVVPHRFETGSILSDRFRIVRFIARGGMGEVYEAEDKELRERVAVKAIRRDLMDHPRFLETFRREVHLAKQVTHPNVCRIYDLFRHADAGGESVFVSMEFLNGVTLAERLERSGRMETQEALPIILQMAEALNAAHVSGILHRDFKPGNVILVPRSKTRDVRAVVTDFGLAFEPGAPGAGTPSTSPGVLGTPAYMAPEQIEGHELTAASDIYALGLVMHEMITGRTPFEESAPLLSAAKRLYEPPIPPRQIVPDLNRTFESVILQCLAREPSDRPQIASDIVEALGNTGLVKSLRRKRGVWTWPSAGWVAVSAVLAVAMIASLYYFKSRRSQRLAGKDTVVLADFKDETGDAGWDDALKQGLRVELEQSPYLNLLSDERVTELLQYMGRSSDERLTEKVTREVCERAGSKAMLLGSISGVGSHYAIGLKAVNCRTEDSVGSLQIEASSREDVLAKLHRLGSQMRGLLGESLVSIEKYDTPVEESTPSLEALQAYSAALKTRRSSGDLAALPLLRGAIELDPNFAMAYAALAAVYSNLGNDELSRDSARKAYELRERVTEKERLYIDSAYYNMATGELDKEREVYERWMQTYPRDQVPHQKLAYSDSYRGSYANASEGFQAAMKLDPGDITNYVDLSGTYISLDRFDDATAVLDEARARQLRHEYIPQLYYLLAFMRNDAQQMERWSAQTEWAPRTEDILFTSRSDTEAFHGRARNARDLSSRSVALALQNREGRAAFWLAHAALREAELGYPVEARREALAALARKPEEGVRALAGLALARAGDAVRAQAIASDLSNRSPADTWLNGYWLPDIRAAIQIDRTNPVRARELLQATEPYETGGDPIALDTLYPIYLRGLAYLMGRQGKLAAAEFQKMLNHRGRLGNSPLSALSHLQLGRAYAATFDTRAKAEYQEFLALWMDADPESPVLRQALVELAHLR